MRRSLRIVITLAIMAIFATGAYAFTAQNSVPQTYAGAGNGAVEGYTAGGVSYILNSNEQITHADFNLSPDNATTVFASLLDSSETALVTSPSCVSPAPSGKDWRCSFGANPAPIANVEHLRVVAAQ